MLQWLLVNSIIVNNRADLLLLLSNSMKHKESNVFKINSHLYEQNDWFPDLTITILLPFHKSNKNPCAKLSDPSDEIVAGTSEVVVPLSVSV